MKRVSAGGVEKLHDLFETTDQAFRETLGHAARAAPTDASVLITGPSGTGKGRLARGIHGLSGVEGEFVEISCASLPEELIESELFGFEKGSFTDAKERRKGLVEQAREGSLYLDEISDLPAAVQPKLLRFVQDGSFRRLGGIAELRARTRFISSTSIDLDRATDALREDLLYRLNVIHLRIPPLRERSADIRRLAISILEKESNGEKDLTQEAIALLESHHWPGNVRELRNVLIRALIVVDGSVIKPSDLNLEVSKEALIEHASRSRWSLEQLEKRYIRQLLRETGRNYSEAARILGINRKTLLEKRKKYRLDE